MINLRICAIIAALLTTLLHQEQACALSCPAMAQANSNLVMVPAEQRLRFIGETLEGQSAHAAWWNGSFIALSSFMAGMQGTLVFTTTQNGEAGESNLRAYYALSGSRALLAAVVGIASPIKVTSAMPQQHLAQTPAQYCARLARAEAALLSTAKHQLSRTSPFRHLVVAGVALTSALVLGLGFDEWRLGSIAASVSVVGGELRYWTQPSGAISALEQYRKGAISGPGSQGPHLAWRLGGVITGRPTLSLALNF